ncbi:ABC transporter permease [Marininema halotolerans]|uniref:Fluoroquinolone transport system permease protein n=1 Tax=Marininema halotolerans TaxID=1155944 RepID=A0A1I6QNE4_9BACL|nr:ABC transporter permease [Marininema halotolerans]SFS53848.1 fluoroquinolone transport system permease protein [Marininema halotolerans]
MTPYLWQILQDGKNSWRDPTTGIALLGPPLLTLAFRWGIPWVDTWLRSSYSFDLTPYHLWILGLYLLLIPMMIGMVAGFLLLDERDEGILLYYRVTPLSETGHLLRRLGFPMILSFLFTIGGATFIHFTSVSFIKLLLCTFLASLTAPFLALLLAAFADNKVEGIALSKIASSIFILPIAVTFLAPQWRWLSAILPPYWAVETLMIHHAFPFAIFFLMGLMDHLLVIYWLTRRLEKRVS